jgi:glycosyltransferase involved in cell wall biosynthesis
LTIRDPTREEFWALSRIKNNISDMKFSGIPTTMNDQKSSARNNRIEGGLSTLGKRRQRSISHEHLVTVVTVVRNGRDCIEQTINSILNQTYENIEYVIIDGSSTDGTVDVIRQYQDRIVYWMSEPDNGIYDAMNKGIERATGEWINFMNAGDIFYENRTIEKIFSHDYRGIDIIYGDHTIIYDNNNSKIWRAKNIDQLWKGMIFCHQSSFIRTALMKKDNFRLENRISADFDLLYALYLKGYTFLNTQIIISSVLADGLSGSNTTATTLSHWRTVRRYSNNCKINSFYAVQLLNKFLKKILKRILPVKWSAYLRSRI